MPRPGQTPPVRGGPDAPHGTNAALARLSLPEAAQQPGAPVGMDGPEDPTQPLNEGYDEFITGPSMRPQEPVTAGAPFGAGQNFVRLPSEDERTFMLRVADELDAGGVPGLGPYTAKIREGR